MSLRISTITLSLSILVLVSTFSYSRTFIREYTYDASEADSKLSARAMAMSQVKELLFEELGTYIKSSFKMEATETGTEFTEFSTSEIASMTAGITQTTIVDEKWDGETYYLKAKINVDEEDVKKRVKEISKNRDKLDELEKLKKEAEAALEEIKRLRKELELAHTEKEKLELQKKYIDKTNTFTQTDWYQNVWLKEMGEANQQDLQPRMEVVFVLDATGSMKSMINNAKDKIWSIATTLAQSEPAPILSLGLIAYRDRGDAYITEQIPMTTDIDELYFHLMKIFAAGGGDMPESVNQALAEAVNDYPWDQDPGTYRSIFLVGDSPPHMDYSNDIRYPESCKQAAARDIIINTVQCGNNSTTTPHWQKIAYMTNGEYLRLGQQANALAVRTPYDAELARLGMELEKTKLVYGTMKQQQEYKDRMKRNEEIQKRATKEEAAKRAIYNVTTKSGAKSFYGNDDILQMVEEDEKVLDELSVDLMPAEVKDMDKTRQVDYIQEKLALRKNLERQIAELDVKRDTYVNQHVATQPAAKSSFNNSVFEVTSKQIKGKKFKAATRAKY